MGADVALGGDCGGLPAAPDSVRVDLVDPVFSAPTDISNALFPLGELQRALFNGLADGEPFRSETTLMPGTKTIVVSGAPIETIISQYVAWVDGRIHELALDWYAEDADGNVWYLGEDVFNYEEIWLRQLRVDSAARDEAAVLSDLESIRIIRERFAGGAHGAGAPSLESLRAAALVGDDAAVEAAAVLASVLASAR